MSTPTSTDLEELLAQAGTALVLLFTPINNKNWSIWSKKEPISSSKKLGLPKPKVFYSIRHHKILHARYKVKSQLRKSGGLKSIQITCPGTNLGNGRWNGSLKSTGLYFWIHAIKPFQAKKSTEWIRALGDLHDYCP